MLDKNGFDLWANHYEATVRQSEDDGKYPFAGYQNVLNFIYRQIKSEINFQTDNSGQIATLLDIGFGTGILSEKLYEEGVSIYGIDFSDEMIRLAKEKMPQAALYSHDFTEGLPAELAGKKFDFITSTYAIHHLTDAQKTAFLHELKTHLTESGIILLGDVAFETQAALETCRQQNKEEWDDEEYYLVAEHLKEEFPESTFVKFSDCSGVFIL